MADKPIKEITSKANKISVVAPKSSGKEIGSESKNLDLFIEKDTELGGIGMGVLSDGTPYLNQRGLAALCGVQNAHIGMASYMRWQATGHCMTSLSSAQATSIAHTPLGCPRWHGRWCGHYSTRSSSTGNNYGTPYFLLD
ncbi:MAG: hypothetical protein AAGJ50_03605 [Pseudomonadota bacterium]